MPIRTIHSALELENYLTEHHLTWEQALLPQRELFGELFPVRIPYAYADLIDWMDPRDPLRRMVVPDPREQSIGDYERIDPIGDTAHEPVPGLIHRYPDRCLLILTTHCGVHCRFCFRREYIGKPRPVDIARCFTYLEKHREIREVILTGGDPATFPEGFLFTILTKINKLPHIKHVRVHTRALVMDPTMVSDSWVETWKLVKDKNILIALHINHPREITPGLSTLVQKMRQLGITLLSQTVLLKGINDRFEVLEELFVQLSQVGIQPYYLHHLDLARGTHHFRISIEAGRRLFHSLRGKISGHSLPEYVLDLPGGDGKYPVMWLKEVSSGVYEAKNFKDEIILYKDPMKGTL